MKATAQIPMASELRRLASQIRVFPISGLGITQYAEHTGHPARVVNFVRLFSKKMIFWSRADFLNYCILLRGILKEEASAPAEQLRSP